MSATTGYNTNDDTNHDTNDDTNDDRASTEAATRNRPVRMSLLLCAMFALLASACGGSSEAAVGGVEAVSSGGGDVDVTSDDDECPFISTAAVSEATGISEFTKVDFRYQSREYICSWETTAIGPAVHMLAKNGGSWPAERLDNPTMWGDNPGHDHVVDSIGPMGVFLEVWTADKSASNYVYGDQIYAARGPYTADESGNRYAEFIIGWYGTNDPSESNDILQQLLDATDENYVVQTS